MLNRGDRAVISVDPELPLNNPLSGSVVDLCPVGALTHRDWRFNTRVWFTKATDSICPGCSTGCNVRVHERDGKIVQVKARLNSEVNKEWLCDEGRYGFDRFLPEKRLTTAVVAEKHVSLEDGLRAAESFLGNQTSVLVSPDLLLEDYLALKSFLDKVVKKYSVAIAYRERSLDRVQKVLVSPDYAGNFHAAAFAGLVTGDLEAGYEKALSELRAGSVERVLCVGERSILASDRDPQLLLGIAAAKVSVGMLSDADSGLVSSLKVVLPARSIFEKSGMMINRAGRLQYAQAVLSFPEGSHPEWRLLSLLAARHRVNLFSGPVNAEAMSDRELTQEYLKNDKRLAGITIKRIKAGGISLVASEEKEFSGHDAATSSLPAGSN
jgi:NADH-quinone oxidoreductase subunit G